MAVEVQSESELCGFAINLLIICGYLFRYRMIASGEEVIKKLVSFLLFLAKSQPSGESSNPSTRSSIKDLKYFDTDYY